jgi:outer membrane protein assembly factor BamB
MKHLAWFVAILAAAADSSLLAEDWYRFRGPELSGKSAETLWTHQWPAGGPNIAWRGEVGTGFSSISISENRLYTIGNQENVDTIHCLNADSGEKLWTHSYSSPLDPNEFEGGPTSTPTVDGDTVFTLSRGGDLFAIDKASGQVRWSKNVAADVGIRIPAWGFSGSPLVLDGLLILNVGDAGVALDKKTGKLIWASQDKDSGYSTPLPFVHQGRRGVIFGSSRSYVCVDPASGKELWRQRWLTTFGCNAADPIVRDPYVFLSSGYNRGSALLDLSSDPPQVVWKHKDFQNQMASSVWIDGHLYGASGDVAGGAKLACIDMMSGAIRWSEDAFSVGALIAAGDRLIILSDSGDLVVAKASPQRCEILATHRVLEGKCWTPPAFSGGRVYCRNAGGQMVCVDLRQ